MAEVVERINELKALPPDQHLFCPRGDEDSDSYYDEDVANDPHAQHDEASVRRRARKVKEAEERKWAALEALQILAFDGDEAAPHQEWLLARLDKLMTSCDVCVRVFHQSRAEWKHKLVEQFDEDMVREFLRIVDGQSLERIKRGLDEANTLLQHTEPAKRGLRVLSEPATYAFFEALSCDAFIRDDDLLQAHFDTPFELVQTKKRLRIQTFLPAMTRFLFSSNELRQNWALTSWSTFKRNVFKSEFEWAVRDHLVDAMMRVQISNLDLPFVAPYWAGVTLIIQKLDKDLITHSIRGLDGDFYRLLLDHLQLNSEGFLDLIATMTAILKSSPTDFWDAIDAITPSTATVVEQVFNSPVLKQIFLAAMEGNEEDMANLHGAFAWISPFLSSIKGRNLPPAVRAFANALLGRFQSDHFSRTSRAYCFREGLRVLDYAFRKMCEGKLVSNFVGQPTVNGMLDILSGHVQIIVTALKRLQSLEDQAVRRIALSVVQYAFTLEAQSLFIEKELISGTNPSPIERTPSRQIWKTILQAIDPDNIDLATHLLIAGRNLVGLEPLFVKSSANGIHPAVRLFNERVDLLAQSITDVIDRLAEFDATKLNSLFEQAPAATAIVSSLFSSSEDTRNSAIELLKVISSQDERRDALQYVLKEYYKNVLVGISDSYRRVKARKTFAPSPSMIRTSSDIIDVMCNSQDGILRSRNFNPGEAGVTMMFWKLLWETLTMCFQTTEGWALMGYDKGMMMDFCRDVMQFADQLFDQCSIFATALGNAATSDDDGASRKEVLKELLKLPATAMGEIKKWLRLRDEYLNRKSVTLISKLLIRLHHVSIEIDAESLQYIEKVLTGVVRAKLSMQQQAELQRALETHLGRSIVKDEEEPVKEHKQASISKWMSTGTTKEAESRAKPILPGMAAFTSKRESLKAQELLKAKQAKVDEQKNAVQSEFKRKRQLELEKEKQKRAAEIAKAKANRGLSGATAEAGSGLEGLGVLGKDQAAKGEGLMHSSDESDEEGDFDEDLFGIKKTKVKTGAKTNIVNEIKVQMPVKKRRVVRSAKDMRARLAPDLSPLHQIILGWDFFHQGDFPPKSRTDIYKAVSNIFQNPNDYQDTFEPLLRLEAWQGFVQAREQPQNLAPAFEIRITTKASVDTFQELSSTMTHQENRDIGVSEGDIILLSKSKKPTAEDPHCLAKVIRVSRKPAHVEVSYRIVPSNPLQPTLIPNKSVFGTKIQSLTPLEREYGALKGLQYYDLCDEIIRAKPSPLLTYKDSQLDPLVSNYKLNKAQAKAVKSAMDNDAFTLIQGPPGSGKTKTIVAIVGAILSDSLRQQGTRIHVPGQPRSDSASKKLLVCAPSNAAVDELVMRFKDGVRTLGGEERKLNIVRLGRSDAINANVQDVTLEELVSQKLGVSSSKEKDQEATRKLFQDHKEVSEQLRTALDQRDSGEVKGPDASKLQDDIIALRKRKQLLGTKIDDTKDSERRAGRNAEMARRIAQQDVLNDAHVICATLSGSGHDMFQGLSIEFETVIVDEAAQCVEMSALIPLKYGAAKCILVGDPKQLPPTVFSREAARFQYEQSLFVRMQKNHPNDVHLLDTQYRMHPEISSFPSQTFYDGRLLDGGDMATLRKQPWHQSLLLGPYRFFDVKGQHSAGSGGRSLVNMTEINVAMQLYQRLTSDFPGYDFKGKIGIITPYKAQLRELKTRFANQYGPTITEDVEFNTTDAFQGRESEVIIFSCVRAGANSGIGFLQDIRRMNVGLTRAKSSLWVLGDSDTLVRGEFWRKLVEDAKSRKRYTDGKVSQMLKKHSSSYPAPPGAYDGPRRPRIRQEQLDTPMSRTGSNQSSTSSGSEQRKPAKQDIKQEPNLVYNPKRKLSDEINGDDGMADVKMEDVDSEGADSKTMNGSGASTPAQFSDSVKHSSATPTPEPTGPKLGDAFGGMAKPKIRRKPRPPPNPLLTRPPKKPKMG